VKAPSKPVPNKIAKSLEINSLANAAIQMPRSKDPIAFTVNVPQGVSIISEIENLRVAPIAPPIATAMYEFIEWS
jgi:hypothetical protein